MTALLYLLCALMYLLGQALQLFWVKIPALKSRANAANYEFNFKEYWRSDWNLIIGTFIVPMMIFIGLDEIVTFKPEIMGYLKWGFGFLGFTGQSIILAKFSKFEKVVIDVIDVKTNIADNK